MRFIRRRTGDTRRRRRLGLLAACCGLLCFIGCARPRPVTPAPTPPDALDQLRLDLGALLDQPGHRRAAWGVAVHSLTRDDRLFERNARTLLVPASVMKLVTVAAAADAVGWDFSFETRALATGPVENGALRGDLVVVGSGDPTVMARGVEGLDAWVDALRRRGISRIEGRIVADDDLVDDARPGVAWSWEDMGFAYGALAGALNLAENKVTIVVSPGSAEGLPTVVELPPEARDLPLVNRSVTAPAGTERNLWPELRPGERDLSIHGVIAVGDAPAAVTLAAGNPSLWFARALRNRLLAAGIDVEGTAVDIDDLPVKPPWRHDTTVHVHRSPRLAEIVKPIVKDSLNLHAEAVLRLAAGPGTPRTTEAGLAAVRARVESWNIPGDGIQMVDGSGLSRRNVAAPDALITLLRRFYAAGGASPWMQAMAVAGRDGTLASRMRGTRAEGNAIGKSGSMSNVRTLAGYVTTADGEALAFVVMANNFEGLAADVTGTIDRLVARLAGFSRAEPATR